MVVNSVVQEDVSCMNSCSVPGVHFSRVFATNSIEIIIPHRVAVLSSSRMAKEECVIDISTRFNVSNHLSFLDSTFETYCICEILLSCIY